MPSEEHQIISRLKQYHLGKWVSVGTAVWGCRNSSTCFDALKNLIEQRILEPHYSIGWGNRVGSNNSQTPLLEMEPNKLDPTLRRI